MVCVCMYVGYHIGIAYVFWCHSGLAVTYDSYVQYQAHYFTHWRKFSLLLLGLYFDYLTLPLRLIFALIDLTIIGPTTPLSFVDAYLLIPH